jgi:hypothetical protein
LNVDPSTQSSKPYALILKLRPLTSNSKSKPLNPKFLNPNPWEVAERADFIETEIQYIEESEGRESSPEAEAETDAASTSAEEESDTSELPPASSAGVVKTR